MIFISVVPYHHELLVIKDMDVFTSFFCYAKKQKKGLVPYGRPAAVSVEIDGDKPQFSHVEDSGDADLLPATNIGFRR